MIPVLQVLLVLLAIATIVRAPRRLPHWLAAAAALQFALVLQFDLEFAAVVVIYILGTGVLVLLIHADLTLQYDSGSILQRLMTPILPAIILVRLYYVFMFGVFFFEPGSYADYTLAEILLPIVVCVGLLGLIMAILRITRRHPLRSVDLRVGIVVVLFGIILMMSDAGGRILMDMGPIYLLFISIITLIDAEGYTLRRWAIAANAAGFGLMSVPFLNRAFASEVPSETGSVVLNYALAVFGAAVALTCISLIHHPVAAPTPTSAVPPSDSVAHPIGLAR